MERLLRASLAVVSLAAAACGDEPSSRSGRAGRDGARPNVLIVSIDTLRADHLGCYGYAPYPEPVSPQIDQFAQDAVLFEHCFTPRGQTGPSLSSMLTGLYPSHHGVLDNFQPLRPEVTTIAQHLGAAGYETRAFVAFLPIAKTSKAALGFERGDPRKGSFFEAKPTMGREPQSRWDDAVEQEFAAFVTKRRRDAPPFLAWIHLYDVHQPYAAPPPFGAKFAGGYSGPLALRAGASEEEFDRTVKDVVLDPKMRARAPLAEADAKYVVALYDGGIAEADARFGRILKALDASGAAADTIVVLTADHGEELGEHNAFWFHGNSVYDSVLRIPLIVRGPGVIAGRKSDLVQNVDLLPTLLDLADPGRAAGTARSEPTDGISFAGLLHGRACAEDGGRKIAWSEWEHLILGARTQHWKFILNPRGAHPKKPPFDGADDAGYFIGCRELYDVSLDPREQRDLWPDAKRPGMEGSAEIDALRAQVAAEYALRFAGLEPQPPDAIDDPQERDRLRQIGYAGGYALDPDPCKDE